MRIKGSIKHEMKEDHSFHQHSDERLTDEIKFLQIRITELEKSQSRYKLADELLHKTELQQKAILNNIPDMAWLKDKESRFIAVNDAFGRACGLKPEELIGKTDLDVWPSELARRYRDDDRDVMESRRRKAVEEPLEDKEGKIKWIETIKTPIFDVNGIVIGTTGIARDITERKISEDRLREIKAELEIRVKVRTAELAKLNDDLRREVNSHKRDRDYLDLVKVSMDCASEAIYLVASDGRFIYANKKASEVLGYTVEEMSSMRVFDIDPVYSTPEAWARHWQEIKDKLRVVLETTHITKDGRRFPVRIVANYFKFADKEINFGFATDISEEKRVKDELLSYQAKLESLVEQRTVELQEELALRKRADQETLNLKRQMEFILGGTKTGLDIIDAELNMVYIDPEWAKIYGGYKNRKCYEYFMGSNSPCSECGVLKALKTKKIVVTEERLKAENNRPIQVISMPYQDESGKWFVAEVNVDISERKRMEQKLDDYRQHLEEIVKSRTEDLLLEITKHKEEEHRASLLAKNLSKSNRKLQQLSLTDQHTGLYNHRYLSGVIEAEFQRAKRYAHSIAIIMLDIDYFKSINDLYGHKFGDLILKQFAHKLKGLVRKYDIVVRFGGEEFVIISPGINREQSLNLSQRILESLNLYIFGNQEHKIKLKVSIGAVSYPEDKFINGIELVDAADKLLNKAKDSGGNRVYVLTDLKAKRSGNANNPGRVSGVKTLKNRIDKLNKRANQSLTEAIFAFAKTIELKDHYTGEHVELTGHYAVLIAKRLGLSREETELIRQAAMLHDLGKIGISEKILHKSSKLTKKEFEEIKKHPQIGADILRPIHSLHSLIPIIFYHHERWDGKGYPSRLKGEEIPVGARIIALADVYQALTSDRPYRKAYSKVKAMKIIRDSSAKQFDPKITAAFLKILEEEK